MIRFISKFIALAIFLLSAAMVSDLTLQTQIITKDAEAATRRAHKQHHRHEVRARRTTRRVVRSTHAYINRLPAGCARVAVNGTHLHRCHGTYYRPHGNRYVVVVID